MVEVEEDSLLFQSLWGKKSRETGKNLNSIKCDSHEERKMPYLSVSPPPNTVCGKPVIVRSFTAELAAQSNCYIFNKEVSLNLLALCW